MSSALMPRSVSAYGTQLGIEHADRMTFPRQELLRVRRRRPGHRRRNVIQILGMKRVKAMDLVDGTDRANLFAAEYQ